MYPKFYTKMKEKKVIGKFKYLKENIKEAFKVLRGIGSFGVFLLQKFHF